MRYLLAILLPPLAVLLCGRPVQFFLNCFLTLLFWVPGMLHAILVVKDHKDNVRNTKLVRAVKRGR